MKEKTEKKAVPAVTVIEAVVSAVEKTAVVEKTTREKRSEVLNSLANLEKKWYTLEKVSENVFPLNWKKRSIRKVSGEKPELIKIINRCKKNLFMELQNLNSLLDKEELSKIKKDRYDIYLSKEQNLIKSMRIDGKIINGDEIPLDVLLEAERINNKKIKEQNEILADEKYQLQLEALNFLDNL